MCWGGGLGSDTTSQPGQSGHDRERTGPGFGVAKRTCFGQAVGVRATTLALRWALRAMYEHLTMPEGLETYY